MYIQLELMLAMSYDLHKAITRIAKPKEVRMESKKRMEEERELRAMLKSIMENPKK